MRFEVIGCLPLHNPHSELGAWARIEGCEDRLGSMMRYREISWQDEMQKRVGDNYSPLDIGLLRIDELLHGETGMSSWQFARITDRSMVMRMVGGTITRAGCEIVDMMGKGVGIGAINAGRADVAAWGFSASALALIAAGIIENQNGIRHTAALTDVVRTLEGDKRLQDVLRADLERHDIGIGDLMTIATKSYSLNFEPIRLRLMRNMVNPLVTAGALMITGSEWGILAGALGMLAVPMGKKVHAYDLHIKSPLRRFYTRAGVGSFMEQSQRTHLKMVSGLRTIAELPTITQAFMLSRMEELGASLAGSFVAVAEAFRGFSGALTLQRNRDANQRTVAAIRRVLSYVTDPNSLLLTRFNRGVTADITQESIETPIRDGVVVRGLRLPYGEAASLIDLDVQAGDQVRILGRSGAGKSLLTLSLAGRLNVAGSIMLVREGQMQEVRSLGDDVLRREVVLVSKDALAAKGERVYDYFQDIFEQAFVGRVEDQMILAMHILMEDLSPDEQLLLLRSTYDSLATISGNRGLSKHVANVMEAFVELKKHWVQGLLQRYRGGGVNAERVFSSLSQGEKQSVINAVIAGYLLHLSPQVLVLDEVLEGLDSDRACALVSDIDQLIEGMTHKPVVFWLTHTREEVLKRVIGDRYLEYDLVTGMYGHERRLRLMQFLKSDQGWLSGRRYSEEDKPEWMFVRESVVHTQQFLNFLVCKQNAYEDFLRKVEESVSRSWYGDFREWQKEVSEFVGGKVGLGELLAVLGEQPTMAIDLNMHSWLSDLSIMYFLSVVPLSIFSDGELAQIYGLEAQEVVDWSHLVMKEWHDWIGYAWETQNMLFLTEVARQALYEITMDEDQCQSPQVLAMFYELSGYVARFLNEFFQSHNSDLLLNSKISQIDLILVRNLLDKKYKLLVGDELVGDPSVLTMMNLHISNLSVRMQSPIASKSESYRDF